MEKIYPYLLDRQKEMLECIKGFVELESPSRDKVLCDALTEHIAQVVTELTGSKCSRLANENYGMQVRCEWGQGEEQILVLAHCDTVFAQGTLQKNPFRVKEGRAYGPGVFDMKGGLVQGIFALKALSELQIPVKKKIVLLVTTDEEIGSPSSRKIIEEEARKSKYALVLECSTAPYGPAKTMRKGVGHFDITVTGKAAHSGVDFQKGINAINELAAQVLYLKDLTNLEEGTTINVGTISGGTATNVVPAEAVASVDLRVTTLQAAEAVVPKILDLQPVFPGTAITVHGALNRPPFEHTAEVEALYRVAKSLAGKYIGFALEEEFSGGGSDGNFTARFIPTLDGIGAVGDGAHTNEEYILVDELPKRSALIALLLAAL